MALALTAALTFGPVAATAPPCPEPLIHTWGVLCVTPAQHEQMWNPPIPVEQIGEPGVEQWRSMVAYYWPAEHVDRMLRIMDCESGGNPRAKNSHSSATGLFQIMAFWQKAWPGDYTDPWTNAAVAYQIWLEQGYAAWVCRG